MPYEPIDEELGIYDKIFADAIKGAAATFYDVKIKEEKARTLIFYILECRKKKDERPFAQQKSEKLTKMGVFNNERKALHSVATRYFQGLKNRGKKSSQKRPQPKAKTVPAQMVAIDFVEPSLQQLCVEEFAARCRETNEHIITADGEASDYPTDDP
jgi:hypothetical protein